LTFEFIYKLIIFGSAVFGQVGATFLISIFCVGGDTEVHT